MSYKRLLVATDGSETSDLAINSAIQLTKDLNATLCIIHIVDVFPANLPLGIDLERYQDSVRQEGKQILAKAKELSDKKAIATEIELIEISNGTDKISEKIIETAQNREVDIIVIGTHGRRGFRRLLLGSVAEETMRISTIPILLIRAIKTPVP